MKKILKRLSLYRNPLTEQFKEKGILHPEEISYLMEQGAKGWEILVSYLTTKRTLAASPEQTRKEILAVFITDLGWDNTEILFKKHLSPHSQVYLDVWKSLAKYEPSTDFLVKVLNTINIKAALEIIENSFEQGDPLTEILMDPDNDTIKSLVKKSGKLQIHSAENITRYKSIDILAIHDPQAALELIQKLPDFLQRKYFKDYNFDRPNLGRVIASGLLLSWWESLSDSRKKDEINTLTNISLYYHDETDFEKLMPSLLTFKNKNPQVDIIQNINQDTEHAVDYCYTLNKHLGVTKLNKDEVFYLAALPDDLSAELIEKVRVNQPEMIDSISSGKSNQCYLRLSERAQVQLLSLQWSEVEIEKRNKWLINVLSYGEERCIQKLLVILERENTHISTHEYLYQFIEEHNQSMTGFSRLTDSLSKLFSPEEFGPICALSLRYSGSQSTELISYILKNEIVQTHCLTELKQDDIAIKKVIGSMISNSEISDYQKLRWFIERATNLPINEVIENTKYYKIKEHTNFLNQLDLPPETKAKSAIAIFNQTNDGISLTHCVEQLYHSLEIGFQLLDDNQKDDFIWRLIQRTDKNQIGKKVTTFIKNQTKQDLPSYILSHKLRSKRIFKCVDLLINSFTCVENSRALEKIFWETDASNTKDEIMEYLIQHDSEEILLKKFRTLEALTLKNFSPKIISILTDLIPERTDLLDIGEAMMKSVEKKSEIQDSRILRLLYKIRKRNKDPLFRINNIDGMTDLKPIMGTDDSSRRKRIQEKYSELETPAQKFGLVAGFYENLKTIIPEIDTYLQQFDFESMDSIEAIEKIMEIASEELRKNLEQGEKTPESVRKKNAQQVNKEQQDRLDHTHPNDNIKIEHMEDRTLTLYFRAEAVEQMDRGEFLASAWILNWMIENGHSKVFNRVRIVSRNMNTFPHLLQIICPNIEYIDGRQEEFRKACSIGANVIHYTNGTVFEDEYHSIPILSKSVRIDERKMERGFPFIPFRCFFFRNNNEMITSLEEELEHEPEFQGTIKGVMEESVTAFQNLNNVLTGEEPPSRRTPKRSEEKKRKKEKAKVKNKPVLIGQH